MTQPERIHPLLRANSRILVVGAHCDDPELSCGRLMLSLPDVCWRVVYLCADRQARRQESTAAMAMLGISAQALSFIPTRNRYLHLKPDCVDVVAREIEHWKPDLVFVHAYEGGHPDHDTASIYVALAAKRLGFPSDRLIEFPSYSRVSGQARYQQFCTAAGPEFVLSVSARDDRTWRDAMSHFRSQGAALEAIVARSSVERFRVMPQYDYTSPPLPIGGTLWRRLGRFLPINIGILLPLRMRLGYEERWCARVNPLEVLECYRALSR